MNSLEGNDIGSNGAMRLFEELKRMKSNLIRINLGDNQIDDRCMKALGEYIKNNPSIRDIDLNINGITDKGIKDLAPYLIGNKTLKYIHFDKNKGITDESVPILKEMARNSHLEVIGVKNSGVSPNKVHEVAKQVLAVISTRSGKAGAIKSVTIEKKKNYATVDKIDESLSFVGTSDKLPGWINWRLKVGKEQGFGEMGWLDLSKEKSEKGEELLNDSILCELFPVIELLGDSFCRLNLARNNLTSKGASLLFNFLKEFKSKIKVIDLSGNPIDMKCKEELEDFVMNNEHIEKINLANTNMHTSATAEISTLLATIVESRNIAQSTSEIFLHPQTQPQSSTNPKYILENSSKVELKEEIPIDMKCKEALEDFGMNNERIEKIDLRDTLIDSTEVLKFDAWFATVVGKLNLFEGVTKILENGHKNGFIGSSLDLTGKNINDSMMPGLCACFLTLGPKVKILKLGKNGITSRGGKYLFDILKNGRLNVHDIYLDQNQLDDECLPSLCSLIVGRKDIKNVYLSGNRITDNGVKVLPDFLTNNASLSHFDLSNNKGITDDSFEILLKIAASSKLKKLYVSGTSMTGQNKNNISNIIDLPPERRMANVHKFIMQNSILTQSSTASSTSSTSSATPATASTPIQTQSHPVKIQEQFSTPTYLENQSYQKEETFVIEQSHSMPKYQMLQELFSSPKDEGSQISRGLQSALTSNIYHGLSLFFDLKDEMLNNAGILDVSLKLDEFERVINQVENMIKTESVVGVEEFMNEVSTFCAQIDALDSTFTMILSTLNEQDKRTEMAERESSRAEIIENFKPILSFIDVWRTNIAPTINTNEWNAINDTRFNIESVKESLRHKNGKHGLNGVDRLNGLDDTVATQNVLIESIAKKNELIHKTLSSMDLMKNAIQHMNNSMIELNKYFAANIFDLERRYKQLLERKSKVESTMASMNSILHHYGPKVDKLISMYKKRNQIQELDNYIEDKDKDINEMEVQVIDIQRDMTIRRRSLNQTERESLEHKMRDLEEKIKFMRWEHEDLVEEFNKQCFDEITGECLFPDLVKQIDESSSGNRELIRIPNVLKIKSNRCELLEKIGGGGFSSVYKMKMKRKNKEGDEMLAFKQFGIATNILSKGDREMIEKEIELLSQLEHENIVKIVGAIGDPDARDINSHPIGIGIVMEFCEKGSLRLLLTNNKHLDERRLINILFDIACGLEYLHTHEPTAIIHGDIKSDNILIDKNFNAKLCDFGISKLMQTTMASSAARGGTGGTLPYRAPEVFDGRMELKSDIYSFGCVILEMLTGERPWNGLGEAEVTKNVTVDRKQHDLSKIGKGIEKKFPELIILMKKCLDYDKSKRIGIKKVKEDLQISRETIVQEEIESIISTSLIESNDYDERRFSKSFDVAIQTIKVMISTMAVEHSRKYKGWKNQLVLHAQKQRTAIEQQTKRYNDWESYCLYKAYCVIIHAPFDRLTL